MPLHALLSRPQTVLKRVAVSLPDRPSLATQEREETMQLQSSELAIGGRLLDAAQAVPVAGQACATVLVTEYAEEAVKLGVALANCLDRAVKSASLLTVSPETVTRPMSVLESKSKEYTLSKLTVVVGLLEIHVHDTTGPDGSHVVTKDSTNLSELTGLNGVATILSEESRDGVVREFKSSLVVTRLGV